MWFYFRSFTVSVTIVRGAINTNITVFCHRITAFKNYQLDQFSLSQTTSCSGVTLVGMQVLRKPIGNPTVAGNGRFPA